MYQHWTLLVPDSRTLQLCETSQHHMGRPAVKEEALKIQRRFKIGKKGIHSAMKQVKKCYLVSQACNPENQLVTGEQH